MAKTKPADKSNKAANKQQQQPPPPQQAILSRLSFLYQAASLLALAQQPRLTVSDPDSTPATAPSDDVATAVTTTDTPPAAAPANGLSRFYTSHLLSVSKKSVQRVSATVKRTICKRCSSVLIPGVSCTTRVENPSKGGRKKWADVVIVQCGYCHATKRFPTDERAQERHRGKRKTLKSDAGKENYKTKNANATSDRKDSTKATIARSDGDPTYTPIDFSTAAATDKSVGMNVAREA